MLGEGEGGACRAGQETRMVLDGIAVGVRDGERAGRVERREDGACGAGRDSGMAAGRACQDAGVPVAEGRAVGIPGGGRVAGEGGEGRAAGPGERVIVERPSGEGKGRADARGAVFSELSNDHEEGLLELELMRSPGGLEDSLGHELSVVVVDAGECFGEIDRGALREAGSEAQHAFLPC